MDLRPDCYKSSVQVQPRQLPSVKSSSNASASHYCVERQRFTYGLESMYTFPNRESLQTVPSLAHKHCFGNELIELTDGSEYDVNACCYFRLPADSHAAINMDEPEETPVKHAVISDPTSARTGGKNRRSNVGKNTTTPSTQLHMVSKARRAYLSRNIIEPPTTEHYFISASNKPLQECKQSLDSGSNGG